MPDPASLPAPPAGLSPEAAALWRTVHAELDAHDLEPDARELAVLREACRHLTLANRLETALADASLTVEGSKGQERVNPLVGEVNAVRRTVAAMLHQLRPVDTTAQAKRAAAARWKR